MSNRPTIRPVTPEDFPEWLRMRLALWPDESETLSADMERYGRRGQAEAVFVAERPGGGLAGFIEVSLRPYANGCSTSPVGYIEGWYVDEDVRRQGVGAWLVHAGEQWARSQNCSEMGSDCLIDNEISWLAHQRLGYRETERVICFCKSLEPETA